MVPDDHFEMRLIAVGNAPITHCGKEVGMQGYPDVEAQAEHGKGSL